MGEIALIKDRSKLSENKAEEIENLYAPMVKVLKDLEGKFNDIIIQDITPKTIKLARELRMEIRDTRILADKARKKAKENILIEGNAIQSAYNTFVYGTKTKEDKLQEIENYYERMEKIKIENLYAERENELKKYTDNIPPNLGEFSEEIWSDFIRGAELTHKDKIKQEEEEKKQKEEEEKRVKLIAQRKELLIPIWQYVPEEIKNSDLSKLTDEEFEQKQAEAKTEKQLEEKRQKAIQEENDKLKKENEDRKAKQKEKDEKAKKDREELEAKLRAKEKKEADEKRIKAEAEERELLKGDTEKVEDMIKDFEGIKTAYTFRSQKNQKMYSDVKELIDKVINHIKK